MWITDENGDIIRPPVLDGIEAFFCADPPDLPGQLADRYAWLFRRQENIGDVEERRRVAYHLGATPEMMDCFLGWDEASRATIERGMRSTFRAAAEHEPPLPIKTMAVADDACSVTAIIVDGVEGFDGECMLAMIAKPVVHAAVQ
jgi:hypothetical protein